MPATATSQSTSKAEVKHPAIAPLNQISVEDLKVQAEHIDTWFRVCGGATLANMQSGTSLPMVANVFALTGSVIDLITVAKYPKTGQAATTQYAYLAMNLIGLTLTPPDEAHARMALRPMLAYLSEALAKSKNGQLPDAVIDTIARHLNDNVAGDIETFILDTKSRLDGLLSSAAALGTALVSDMVGRITAAQAMGGLASKLKNFIGLGGTPATTRNPNLQFTNWAETLYSLMHTPTAYPANSNNMGHQADTTAALGRLAGTLSAELAQQSNVGTKGSIGWILDQTAKAIKANRKKGAAAAVPVSTVGVHHANVSGATLEYMSLQADEVNKPSCDAAASGTGGSISFAMGTERITHNDFTTTGVFPIIGSRLYASDLAALDDGEFGARWITPYTTRVIQTANGLTYIGGDARSHHYPALKDGQTHHDPIEKRTISRLNANAVAIGQGKDWVETYEQQGDSNTYRLTMMADTKASQTVGLRYDHKHPTTQQPLLSDIITKKGDTVLSHVGTQISSNGQIVAMWQIKDGQLLKQLSHYRYDAHNNLTLAQDENAQHWTYEYNAHHQLTRYTDRTGRGQNIRYDGVAANARAVHEWADDGSFDTQLVWDKAIRKVTVTRSGTPTDYYYDLLGYTYRIVYANGLEEWFYRDTRKNIIQHARPDGGVSRSTFDEHDQLTTATSPDGGTTRFQYNAQQQLIAIQDPEGGVWQRDYDPKGNLSEQVDPLGRKTEYRYNALGLPIEIVDAKGGKKQISYTPDGQMASFTDCSDKTSTWTYDKNSRLIKQTNAAGQSTRYTYADEGAERGQLKAIEHADGQIERLTHDAEGRLLSHTDPKGQRTTYEYTLAGLIAKRTDAAGNSIAYEWDKAGRLRALINANQAEYRFHYNVVGQLIQETGFDGKTTSYDYNDANGLLYRVSDEALMTGVAFDAMGRIRQRTVLNRQTQAKQTETFDFSLNGQLIQAKNAASTLAWHYDAAGQLIREHQTYQLPNQPSLTAIWRHEYDVLGNRSKTIRPDGHVIQTMTYGSGHVHGLMLDQLEAIAFERDDLHREVNRTQANHLRQTVAYDKAGRLTQQLIAYVEHQGASHAPTQTGEFNARRYAYDTVGQLTHIKDNRRGALEYQYDPVGRLLSASSALGQELFAFDPAGNIAPVAPSTANELPNQPNQVQAEGQDPAHKRAQKVLDNLLRDYVGTHYEYDVRGNMIERTHNGQTTTFVWDNFNRMIESVSDDVRTTYAYDALGRRIAKHSQTTFNDGSSNPTYLHIKRQTINREKQLGLTLYGWDGDTMAWESTFGSRSQVNEVTGQIEAAFDTSRTTHYIYEPNSFVPMVQATQSGTIQLLATPDYSKFAKGEAQYDIDQDPVWRHQPEQRIKPFDAVAFYQCDHLGTPQELTDMNGEIAWAAEYKAWGLAYEATSKAAKQAGIKNPIRFQGQYFDHETGLHYNRHRYYDPHSGRFMSKDPIGLQGGMNSYYYAPNPVYWSDPLGLKGEETLTPGPYAAESIPARGPTRSWTVSEQTNMNAIGDKFGCHTCGVTTPGTKSGNWILDHQPPSALNQAGAPQKLFPHCVTCSAKQGGKVSSMIKKATKKLPVVGAVVTAVTLAPSVAEAAQGEKSWTQFCSDLLADLIGADDAN